MKNLIRILFWCIVFAGMCLLFCLTETQNTYGDESISITVLSGEGQTTMTLDKYLSGALGAEMPASFEPEALKAQTVAIRSYVLAGTKHGDMTVCTDSTCCLGYQTDGELSARWGENADTFLRKLQAAVRSTDGEYLVYNGEPAQAVFHASSSGVTENSAALWYDIPYLVSVETPETAADITSSVTFSPDELSQLLDLNTSLAPSDWIESIAHEFSGRIQSVMIAGISFSGTELRSRLGLAGTDFNIAFDGTNFVFTVRGKGHGVGMSQTGANIYAGDGWDYTAILAHYYPGTELVSLSQPSQECPRADRTK